MPAERVLGGGMLIQRVATALVLLPLLLSLVWFAPTAWLYGVLSAVGGVIAWEWAALMGWTTAGRRALYAAIALGCLGLAWRVPAHVLVAVASVPWWLAAPLVFAGYPQNLQRHRPGAVLMGALGLVLIVSAINAVATLHAMPNGPLRLLFVLFLVFAADTGAFLAGRAFGKRKLAPEISPGKSIEGALGGLLLCAAWALTAGVFVFEVYGAAQVAALLGLSLIVAVASVIGDLSESMFKRMVGVKDSGHILPGHGGILDRVDSILAAAPVMVLGLQLTGL